MDFTETEISLGELSDKATAAIEAEVPGTQGIGYAVVLFRKDPDGKLRVSLHTNVHQDSVAVFDAALIQALRMMHRQVATMRAIGKSTA